MKTGHQNSVGLPVNLRRRVSVRPSIAARAVRAVDKLITRTQEWLEGRDRRLELAVAYTIIAVVLVVIGAAVVSAVLKKVAG